MKSRWKPICLFTNDDIRPTNISNSSTILKWRMLVTFSVYFLPPLLSYFMLAPCSYLSLSDCALGIEIVYFHVLQYLKHGGHAYLLQCMAITNIIGGTVLSSLLQTLLICLERLNATYPIKLKILEALTGNKAVGICFGSCHCFSLVRFGITTIGGILPCDDKYTINPIILFSNDLIVIILIITISVCYIIVIMRLLKLQKYIGLILTGVSENQGARRNTSSLRMRKNALTLGMIIILSVITTLPRTITGMYSYAVGGSEKAISVMWLTNKIILVNPLVDLSFTFSG